MGADFTEVSGGFDLTTVALVAVSLATASSCAFASFSLLVGGSGGSVSGLYAGGTLRPSDPWLVTDEMVRACDRVEPTDLWETSEEVEPRLSLLVGCVEVLLGRVGGACEDALRLGRGGGALLSSCGVSTCEPWVSRRGSGGGAGFEPLGRCGRIGTAGALVCELLSLGTAPLVNGAIGAVWLLVLAATGRPGGGGGAGLRTASEPLKFFCWLRAAMRSFSVVNWGSSVSVMMAPALLSGSRRVVHGKHNSKRQVKLLWHRPKLRGCKGSPQEQSYAASNE